MIAAALLMKPERHPGCCRKVAMFGFVCELIGAIAGRHLPAAVRAGTRTGRRCSTTRRRGCRTARTGRILRGGAAGPDVLLLTASRPDGDVAEEDAQTPARTIPKAMADDDLRRRVSRRSWSAWALVMAVPDVGRRAQGRRQGPGCHHAGARRRWVSGGSAPSSRSCWCPSVRAS